MPSWFWLILTIILAALLLAVVFWSVYDSSKQIQTDESGFIELSVPAGIRLMMGLSFICAGFLVAQFFNAVVEDRPLEMWLYGIFGTLFMAGSLYCCYGAFFVKVRFNEYGIEYHRILERRSIPWHDVRKIVGDVIAGAVIVTANRRYGLFPQAAGFFQLMEEAERQGVKVGSYLMQAR